MILYKISQNHQAHTTVPMTYEDIKIRTILDFHNTPSYSRLILHHICIFFHTKKPTILYDVHFTSIDDEIKGVNGLVKNV